MRSGIEYAFIVLLSVITAIAIEGNSLAAGGTIQLPKTGQTSCYDGSGRAISCANTGQDGNLQKGVEWPKPRFTTNADTTITDNLTKLVWAPNGNLAAREPQWENRSIALDGAVTWQNALDYVAKLNREHYLGHDDWRLPNFTELGSLVNLAQVNTAQWLNGQGFVDAQTGDYYWTSTILAADPSKAWAFDMDFGNVHYFDKDHSHYVWPVRGGL